MNDKQKVDWVEIAIGVVTGVVSLAALIGLGTISGSGNNSDEENKNLSDRRKKLLLYIENEMTTCRKLIDQNKRLFENLTQDWDDPHYVRHRRVSEYHNNENQRVLDHLLLIRQAIHNTESISSNEITGYYQRIASLRR